MNRSLRCSLATVNCFSVCLRCVVTVAVRPGCSRGVCVLCRVGFGVRGWVRTSLGCYRRVWLDWCVSALEHWRPACVQSEPVSAGPKHTQKTSITEWVWAWVILMCVLCVMCTWADELLGCSRSSVCDECETQCWGLGWVLCWDGLPGPCCCRPELANSPCIGCWSNICKHRDPNSFSSKK